MNQPLSIAFRPQSFESMVGSKKLIQLIRGHIESGRLPQAWLFSGDSGVGKTSTARILALSLQCPHQKLFGNPCQPCQKNKTMYDIMEVNASEVSGVEDIGRIAESSLYAPRPPSRYRVFILDELHRASSESMNLLLKYFEDCPKTSIWIICTTLPQKILRTLRSRCVYYEIPGLKLDGIKALVERAIQFAKGSKPADPLVDALAEQGVWNPRFILQAVEKYLAGGSPEQSASVDSVEISVDTLKICRTLVNGNWQGLRVMLRVIPPDESRPVAQAIMGYLTTIILTSDTLQQRAASVEGIYRLSKLGFLDDGMRRPALMAILYDLTQMFSGKRQVVKSRVDDDGD